MKNLPKEPEGMFKIVDGVTCRLCNKCKAYKFLELEFDKSKSGRRGRKAVCRRCVYDNYIQPYNQRRLSASDGESFRTERNNKGRDYYQKNAEDRREYAREYSAAHRVEKRAYNQSYHHLNRKKTLIKRKIRRTNDLNFRIRDNISSRVREMLRYQNTRKTNKTMVLLSCTIQELRTHLESLWQPGMSWENHGVYRVNGQMTWHIDHIVPCAAFDLTKEEEQRKCFHYTNLQPLWALENMRKSDNLPI